MNLKTTFKTTQAVLIVQIQLKFGGFFYFK